MRGTGIIPAYAGNTCIGHIRDFLPWDHPRVCGEHSFLTKSDLVPSGSSPRMRGTHNGFRHGGYRIGIIPAYAGNTGIPFDSFRFSGDHPRVCGEHLILLT